MWTVNEVLEALADILGDVVPDLLEATVGQGVRVVLALLFLCVLATFVIYVATR